jgi:hypothetical protein
MNKSTKQFSNIISVHWDIFIGAIVSIHQLSSKSLNLQKAFNPGLARIFATVFLNEEKIKSKQ